MTVASATHLDTASEAYVAGVLETIEGLGFVTVLGAYVLGSGAVGGFEPGRSDIDLVVVVDRKLNRFERSAVVEAIGRLGCPARRLELVLYARGDQPPAFQLNLNVETHGAAERADEPAHWFVIDAALAQERAVPVAGPAWRDLFAPIAPDQIQGAMNDSIAWSEQQPAENEFTRLNAARARHYLDHGEWISKEEAKR